MPVWHEALQELGERDDLVVIGVTQEQHPDRCRLFAQWHGIDWPILWDPFNSLGVDRVPLTLGVDEHGILRGDAFNPRHLGSKGGFTTLFLDQEYEAPQTATYPVRPVLPPGESAGASQMPWVLSKLLHPHTDLVTDQMIELLARWARRPEAPPYVHFNHGVALRMRHDSPQRRPTDFQDALDAWTRALIGNPGQYIWRRRIQQWGPRLDKPYSFYDWVDQARAAILERGEIPHPLSVRISGAELAEGTKAVPNPPEAKNPDPDGKIPRDEAGRVRLDVAVVHHTGYASGRWRVRPGTARVHLTLNPDAKSEVHFEDEGGATEVWLELPEGWLHEGQRLQLRPAIGADFTSPRGVDFEIVPPEGHQGTAVLKGFVLYPVCVGETGTCTYLRQDFEVTLPEPPGSASPPDFGPPPGEGDGDAGTGDPGDDDGE